MKKPGRDRHSVGESIKDSYAPKPQPPGKVRKTVLKKPMRKAKKL